MVKSLSGCAGANPRMAIDCPARTPVKAPRPYWRSVKGVSDAKLLAEIRDSALSYTFLFRVFGGAYSMFCRTIWVLWMSLITLSVCPAWGQATLQTAAGGEPTTFPPLERIPIFRAFGLSERGCCTLPAPEKTESLNSTIPGTSSWSPVAAGQMPILVLRPGTED